MIFVIMYPWECPYTHWCDVTMPHQQPCNFYLKGGIFLFMGTFFSTAVIESLHHNNSKIVTNNLTTLIENKAIEQALIEVFL